MSRRIYWLLPNLESAQSTMDDLLLMGIEVRHIHFVAREGSDMSGLNSANVLQTSDVVRAAERGLIIGAGVGALIGALVAVHYPIVGDEPQWGVAAVLAVAGAVFGTWSSSMIGVSTPRLTSSPWIWTRSRCTSNTPPFSTRSWPLSLDDQK